MRCKSRICVAVSVLGMLWAAVPAWATGDEIELDPGGGSVKIRNLGAAPPQNMQPGKSLKLRKDVALEDYQLCYVQGGTPKPASRVTAKTFSLCDPTKSNTTALSQSGNVVNVVVNGTVLNASNRRCEHSGPNPTCVGNGMPVEMWGPSQYFKVIDRTTGDEVTGPLTVRLVPGQSCGP